MILRYNAQTNGRTSFEIVIGRKNKLPIAVFGESIDFMYTQDKKSKGTRSTAFLG